MFNIFKKKEVRRYNFIVGTNLLYSGLFTKVGLIDFCIGFDLNEKRKELSIKYGIPLKMISISNTIKD